MKPVFKLNVVRREERLRREMGVLARRVSEFNVIFDMSVISLLVPPIVGSTERSVISLCVPR